MTQVYNPQGNVIPVTVIETGPCVVVQKKQTEKDGYTALQIGFGNKKAQRVNKPLKGHMAKANKGAFELLKEFRLDDVSQYEVGQEIKAEDLFKAGDRIDVAGTSKGHGFTEKMAGHWGDEQVSVQNIEVIDIRAEENLLLVRGAVPGAKRGLLVLRRAAKG
jgi:large subunit ribosomal protein L3